MQKNFHSKYQKVNKWLKWSLQMGHPQDHVRPIDRIYLAIKEFLITLKKSGFLVFLEKWGNLMILGPTFLHDNSCLELGMAVSFCWGMSPLDITPHLCYLYGPASLTQSNLGRWGNVIKGQLDAVRVCTCGQENTVLHLVLVLYGRAEPPPIPSCSQPPKTLPSAMPWSSAGKVAHTQAWMWLYHKESLGPRWARRHLF